MLIRVDENLIVNTDHIARFTWVGGETVCISWAADNLITTIYSRQAKLLWEFLVHQAAFLLYYDVEAG